MSEKEPSEIALKAESLLAGKFNRTSENVLYVAAFETKTKHALVLERCRQDIYLWTEAVFDRVPTELQGFLKKSYTKEAPRSSNLNDKNCKKLKRGNPVNYWKFEVQGDLEKFVDWYNTI
jgi:hypothetical protein